MFLVNGLIRRRLGDNAGSMQRILAITEECIALIEVNEFSSAMPFLLDRSDLLREYDAGLVELVPPDEDPCTEYLAFTEDQLTDTQRAQRDAAYAMIAPLVEDPDQPLLFQPGERGRLILTRAQEVGRHKRVLYRHLQRYWMRGQTANALIPRTDKRGGKGKARIARPDQVKRGRKSRLAKRDPRRAGVNVTAEDIEKWRHPSRRGISWRPFSSFLGRLHGAGCFWSGVSA